MAASCTSVEVDVNAARVNVNGARGAEPALPVDADTRTALAVAVVLIRLLVRGGDPARPAGW
eukprot:10740640-Prorocentrum_lima.AAC.1